MGRKNKKVDHEDYIEAEESEYLYVAKSQIKGAGKGLFTAVDLYRDEFVSEYKGEVISEDEAESRAEKNKDKYFISMLDGTILDSHNVDCFAKYANDANGMVKTGFRNNTQIAEDPEGNVCLVVTKKIIKAGEEIFCSYGKEYWKKHALN